MESFLLLSSSFVIVVRGSAMLPVAWNIRQEEEVSLLARDDLEPHTD